VKATNLSSMLPPSPAPATPTGTNALRDIKPPVEIPGGWAWLGWVLPAVLAVAVGILLYRLWRGNRLNRPGPPPIPAHVRARHRLAEALALIGQPREFCIVVSDAARQYLEERFSFHAPERTTEEFLHELQATDRLTPEQKRSLGRFLESCDLVKFARYQPGEPELRDLHGSAVRLVDETEPRPEPPGAPPRANEP